MIAFEPKGTLQAFGEKLGFQVMPISREQAREILEAAYALAAAKSTDAPSVEQMIAQPDKGWMWVMPSARKSSSSTGGCGTPPRSPASSYWVRQRFRRQQSPPDSDASSQKQKPCTGSLAVPG